MISFKTLLYEIAMGDCYQAAGKLITRLPNGHKLVHGMVNGQGALQGKRYGHAWVESSDTVLDHANGKKLEIPKDLYYAIGGIRKEDNKYYDQTQALTWLLKSKQWGPWEMSGDTIDMYEDIPTSHDEVGKEDQKLSSTDIDNIQSLKESVNQAELDEVEAYLDKMFAAIGIDIEFTRHFMDRVNDIRNTKSIEPEEIEDLFTKTYEDHGQEIKSLGASGEAVITDMESNINVPFVLRFNPRTKKLDLISKTVMRKFNFKTSGKKLKV